ncbi:MurR/RpiR family transcriptional regulator [Mycoplasmatota bacterium]|nr:MurR/RpiR family transcriptional regulator [Mycoplasmatota bacterium]
MILNEYFKAYYSQLTKSEKEIATYIEENIENVMYFSIADLSREIGVGESTIVRFCRKLGYRGFYQFKIELAKQYASETNDESEDYVDLIEKNMINVIKSTKLIVNKEKLQEAINLILGAGYIYLYGVGASGLAALEGEGKFMRGGLKCKAVTDSHFQTILSGTLTEKDVIIVISLSGSTKDLFEPIDIAYKNGTKIIVLTNNVNSKLAKYAHVTMQTAGYEKPLDGGSFVAKISQLYMLDLLYTGVVLSDKNKISNNERKAAEAISRKID